MADKENRPALPRHTPHLPEALLLEFGIADCEHLVDEEDLRVEVDNYLLTRDSLYIASGVLAVGALVLFFVEQPNPLEDDEQFLVGTGSLRPWFTPEAAGAGLELTW